MPEGDTVARTARRLHEVFAGHVLTRTDLRWGDLATVDLTGRRTLGVVPRGKHLLHRIEDGYTLHSHLRMEGSWRIERTATPPAPLRAPKIRAVLATADYTAVGWSLGLLDLVRTCDEDTLVGHLGPDLLDPEWSDAHLATAVAHLKAADTDIAAALLDQRNLAGCGTVWTAEPLFAQRLDPWTPTSELTDAHLTALVERARAMLLRSVRLPPGREETYVHGRHHKPCVRCGTLIALGHTGPPTQERVIYYCPRCQGVTSPPEPRPRTPGADIPPARPHSPWRQLPPALVLHRGGQSTLQVTARPLAPFPQSALPNHSRAESGPQTPRRATHPQTSR